MPKSPVPVLLPGFTPGALVGDASVAWAEENIAGRTRVALGTGAHFVQKDHADAMGKAIARWDARTFDCHPHPARSQQ